MINLLPVALLAAASLGAASGETAPASTQITLDPSRAVSAQHLYEQIHAAADQVCRQENRYAAHLPNVQRNCVRDTVERTLSQIDDRVLVSELRAAQAEGLPVRGDQASNTVD